MQFADTHLPDARQETFLTCYRGTQNGLRHAAYMRMGKVLLLQHLLAKWNVSLHDRRILDYGFGAGTFLRHCPQSSQLFGVELDPVCVKEVIAMLHQRGHRDVDLQPLEIACWSDHRLLKSRYDLIVCSHVLEHLADPQAYLKRMAECLESDGLFAGLVPINERRLDPHHCQRISLPMLKEWLSDTRLELIDWVEADPWLYWLQAFLSRDSGLHHRLAQGLSLSLGVAATGLGHDRWFRLSRVFGTFTGSKPTQAAFLLRNPAVARSFT